MNTLKIIAAALLLSASAYAQTQPTNSPQKHERGAGRRTAQDRATIRAERKARFEQMTPAERKAFRETHRAHRQEKLNALSPEKRARVEARMERRKEMRQTSRRKRMD